MSEKRKHDVRIVVGGQEIPQWTSYQIDTSMISPTDRYTLRRPFDPAAWKLCLLDSEIRIYIDTTPVLDGFIDRRRNSFPEDEIEISGFDRGGRLFAESAPAISYQGLELSEVVKRLVDPWFAKVTLSDARNRRIATGKGYKVAGGNEPIYVHRVVKRNGKVHPGQTRWQAIEELCADAGLAAWSSCDGLEFFIGQPNQTQPAQFLVQLGKPGGSETTVKELSYEEDIGEGYSVISVVGTGGGTEQDFGENVSSRHFAVYDVPTKDGTGGDFLHPKRLLMPERQFDSNQDAQQVAEREQARRNFRRRTASAVMPTHGQFIAAGAPTIFAKNTIARVRNERHDPVFWDDFLIYSCSYAGDRQGGETTRLEMVPRGTELVL